MNLRLLIMNITAAAIITASGIRTDDATAFFAASARFSAGILYSVLLKLFLFLRAASASSAFSLRTLSERNSRLLMSTTEDELYAIIPE